MSVRAKSQVLAVMVAGAIQACGAPVETPKIVVEPKLSDIQAKVFNLSCATSGCHTTASANLNGKLDLTDGKSYAQLVGVAATWTESMKKRVDAGKPDDSLLVIKITPSDHFDIAKYGAPMPSGSEALPTQYVEAIRQWITDGAKNN